MSVLSADVAVGRLVAECPGRARVLERYGIDYCCGGEKTLAEACSGKGLSWEKVLRELELCHPEPAGNAGQTGASVSGLICLLEKEHRYLLKKELPRLDALLAWVAAVHRKEHPELVELRRVFKHFRRRLAEHAQIEEESVFPALCWVEEPDQDHPEYLRGTVRYPIAAMKSEHRGIGAELAKLRVLAGGFEPPFDADEDYRRMLAGLADLEREIRCHVFTENSILFARAIAAEDALNDRTTDAEPAFVRRRRK